jgi:protease-4
MNMLLKNDRAALVLLALSTTLLPTTPLLAQKGETDAAAEAAEPTPTKVGVVRFSGTYLDLPEQSGDLTSVLLGGGGGKPKDFYEMLGQLEAAAKSDEYETILVDFTKPFSLNGVQQREVVRAFDKVRASGKHLVAYFESATAGLLQLASACDEIVMADLGVVDFGSPALNVLFMRDAFDLLGVRMDIVRCGDFKGAVEPYMNSRMSDHLRDHYLDMLSHVNDDLVGRIAKGRNLKPEAVRALQKQRLMLASDAKEAGLVDRLVTWQGAEHMIDDMIEGEVEYVSVLAKPTKRRSFNPMTELLSLFNQREEEEEVEEPSIVVLHLQGTIMDGDKPSPGSIISGPVVDQIQSLREDENVRAVVVRINSPGGSATASEEMLLALRELAAEKDVVISMGTLAASGGYYVTCLGRPIFAEASTITGSIGVFGTKPNLGPMFRRVGLHEEIVSLDESATMTSMAQGWSEDQHARMQRMVDNIYERFVGHVAASRRMSNDQVLAIAGGRVWSGEQAKQIGLVDEIGGLHDAIARAAHDAGLKGGEYEVLHMPRPKDFFEVLAQEIMQAKVVLQLDDPVRATLLRHHDIEAALQILVDGLGDQPTRAWAMLPGSFTIR